MTAAPTIHASCLLFGSAGVLIRGPSGSGKSGLVLDLIADAGAEGRFAALVADDRVHLAAHNGRLIARPPASLAGRIEARGFDVVTLPHAVAAVIRLAVDLVPDMDMARLSDENTAFITLSGVTIPALAVSAGAARRLIPVQLRQIP